MTLAAPWHIERSSSLAAEGAPVLAPEETARDVRHPISRWYLLPLADVAARLFAPTRLRPWHVTILGFLLAAFAAAALLAGWPGLIAASCVLAAWGCDRVDGKLARRQGTATPAGAWLDANLDELSDIGLHAAVAAAAAQVVPGPLPWLLFAAFVAGKYLFFHGREEHGRRESSPPSQITHPGKQDACPTGRMRHAINLPGNADVRVHLLVAALAANWLLLEMAIVASYYNLRWLARYGVVMTAQRRKGGAT